MMTPDIYAFEKTLHHLLEYAKSWGDAKRKSDILNFMMLNTFIATIISIA